MESVGTRFLVVIGFDVIHEVIYFLIARGMVRLNLHWNWAHELESAFANAIVAVLLFALLDRLKTEDVRQVLALFVEVSAVGSWNSLFITWFP